MTNTILYLSVNVPSDFPIFCSLKISFHLHNHLISPNIKENQPKFPNYIAVSIT